MQSENNTGEKDENHSSENDPRHGGGADTVFKNTIDLLRKNGECVIPLERRSKELVGV